MPIKLTPQALDRIKELGEQGATTTKIMAELGIHRATALRALKALGIERPGHKEGSLEHQISTDEQFRVQCLQYVEDIQLGRKNIKDVVEILGVSNATVVRNLRKLGLPTKRSGAPSREDHPNWRGGTIEIGGECFIKLEPSDPYYPMANKNGYVLEHRLLKAKHLGRLLTRAETVHHKDGNHDNNRIENLQLRQGQHGNGHVRCCADCGSTNIIAVNL
jgi:hypothetical protein